jgi:hypothetical protein
VSEVLRSETSAAVNLYSVMNTVDHEANEGLNHVRVDENTFRTDTAKTTSGQRRRWVDFWMGYTRLLDVAWLLSTTCFVVTEIPAILSMLHDIMQM